jgi:hypothetical protein
MIGAKLGGAKFGYDSVYSTPADFSFTLLQGVDFSAVATIDHATFQGASLDLTGNPAGRNYYALLPPEGTAFPGFATPSGGSCILAAQTATPNRTARVTTSQPTVPPATDITNTCPDAFKYSGGCGAVWQPPGLAPSTRLTNHTFGTVTNNCSF